MAAEMLTWSLLASVVLTVIVFCVIVWLWGAYLEEHEHDPGRVRAVMVIILAIVTAMEMGLAAYGLVRPRTAVISLLVNLWGGMDALLRFPASHDLESWFSVKQIILLSIKTMGYAWGFLSFRQNLGKFIGLLLLNIWGLPVLYLMALPLDPLEQVADDEYNVDLAYRVLQLVTNYKEGGDVWTPASTGGTGSFALHQRNLILQELQFVLRVLNIVGPSTRKVAVCEEALIDRAQKVDRPGGWESDARPMAHKNA
eukprot:CAMPEP_0197620796 /NCGR_PEP_ID=MMETSP1338-20131121/1540_1 /TAXON_ID=43686 ORGANISM="Pelagodinium beii, Strain RCC1491" /NCGR_SAMPLE_ID=MMETSP1338 /ASSEMBLY_ACC=CAM_ASM_000754 /LENGTH=254 /DNA_ID=CAMNT_0043190071 /DNA_START=79 /DNA_END=844 /DNA_ORIENTATION=-